MTFALELLAIYCVIAIIAMIAFVYWGDKAESADDYHY